MSKGARDERATARLHPNLDESTNAIKLESGERRVFSCWRDARNHEAGVLLATDHRLIVAQSSGVYTLKSQGFLSGGRFASRIPGIIMTSVDYSEMTGVEGRYIGPLSSLIRIIRLFNPYSAVPSEPVPQVSIQVGKRDRIEFPIYRVDARKLLFLLANKTRLSVPSFWMDRLPWERLGHG